MNIYSKSDKWSMILLSIAFVLIDWKIYEISVSDIIFLSIVLILLFKGNFKIKTDQILLYLGVLCLIVLNILLNYSFNDEFTMFSGIKGIIKVAYYMLIIIAFYNNVIEKNLKISLLRILSVTAIIASFIGVYITIAILSKGILPYNFFWKFTRTDLASYTYSGWGRSIVRTRSLFSEPAYLGYYLNTILALLYFNKSKYKASKITDMIITMTVILSFSFSAIIIMIGIKTLNYINLEIIRKSFKSKWHIISALIILLGIVVMWGTIEKTIIIRAREVLSGSDGSGTARLLGSWSYVNKENILIGNGIGNTPAIWNVFAYVLSDLGLFVFLLFLLFTTILVGSNLKLGLIFIMQGFQKGGYLGAGFWILMLLIIMYSKSDIKRDIKIYTN